jgi:hypothetical protein
MDGGGVTTRGAGDADFGGVRGSSDAGLCWGQPTIANAMTTALTVLAQKMANRFIISLRYAAHWAPLYLEYRVTSITSSPMLGWPRKFTPKYSGLSG